METGVSLSSVCDEVTFYFQSGGTATYNVAGGIGFECMQGGQAESYQSGSQQATISDTPVGVNINRNLG
jgi:hypothetical protein